jgi:hypothetical protein
VTTDEMIESLCESYPEALTADGFDDAIVGVVDGWMGDSRETVVCYDYAKCVQILMAGGMDEEMAEEWMDFNVLGAYMGHTTPVFLHDWRKVET